jgi:formylglycine-generating enzyme required for sulfatase activity
VNVCEIPAGRYPIGDETLPQSRPAHTIELTTFAISQTAVTNEQFARFIAADGYLNTLFWSEMGWRWQQHKQARQPAFWDDPTFNDPAQPVVSVCWYEADAFARWLALETMLPWRLPTEAEWEAAARGSEGHEWPGDAPPDPTRYNTAERGVGRTRPSALEVSNVSWCEAYDLSGNVWEWCSSRWGRNWQSLDYPYPYDPNDGREDLTGSHARVMRGGSWFDPLSEARPANRGRYLPGSRGSNIGFRLAYSL